MVTMAIRIRKLRKRMDGLELYRDLSFTAKTGKITAIFGPNGSGKSTLFNILAGVMKPDGGAYAIEPFDQRRFSYLFQNYRETLLPWRTNRANITLPLESQRLDKHEIQDRVTTLQQQLDLQLPLDGYPYELSGGQQQMLAFFRTLITNPNTLLIDEPFSALDYQNWLHFCNILQAYHLAKKPTTLIITHNIEEAAYLAEEIIVFSDKPTRVLGIVKNPLSYPRTVNTLKSAAFHDIKRQVLELFHGKAEA